MWRNFFVVVLLLSFVVMPSPSPARAGVEIDGERISVIVGATECVEITTNGNETIYISIKPGQTITMWSANDYYRDGYVVDGEFHDYDGYPMISNDEYWATTISSIEGLVEVVKTAPWGLMGTIHICGYNPAVGTPTPGEEKPPEPYLPKECSYETISPYLYDGLQFRYYYDISVPPDEIRYVASKEGYILIAGYTSWDLSHSFQYLIMPPIAQGLIWGNMTRLSGQSTGMDFSLASGVYDEMYVVTCTEPATPTPTETPLATPTATPTPPPTSTPNANECYSFTSEAGFWHRPNYFIYPSRVVDFSKFTTPPDTTPYSQVRDDMFRIICTASTPIYCWLDIPNENWGWWFKVSSLEYTSVTINYTSVDSGNVWTNSWIQMGQGWTVFAPHKNNTSQGTGTPQYGDFDLEICRYNPENIPTATPGTPTTTTTPDGTTTPGTPTATATPTPTYPPVSTDTATPYPSDIATPTPSDTPTTTPTKTPTIDFWCSDVQLDCAIYDQYDIPARFDATDISSVTLEIDNQQFVIRGADLGVWATSPDGANHHLDECKIYEHDGILSFWHGNQGLFPYLEICSGKEIPKISPTNTPQPTATPNGNERTSIALLETIAAPTPTPIPTATAAAGQPPTPGNAGIEITACVDVPDPPDDINTSPMPTVVWAVPTLRSFPAITATVNISISGMLTTIHNIAGAVETPATGIISMTGAYDFERGGSLAATMTTNIEPAISWIALLNPLNAAWTQEGGALWAIQPIVGWAALPIGISIAIVFNRFFIAIFNFLSRIWKIITDLIELIPGE